MSTCSGAGDAAGSQRYAVGSDWRLRPASNPANCLQVINVSWAPGTSPALGVRPCSASEPLQVFAVPRPGVLSAPGMTTASPLPGVVNDACVAASGLSCVDQAAAARAGHPLLLRPWCDPAVSTATRARAFVASMTLYEKTQNLGTGGSMNPGAAGGAGGPTWGEGLHGLIQNCYATWHWDAFGGNSSGERAPSPQRPLRQPGLPTTRRAMPPLASMFEKESTDTNMLRPARSVNRTAADECGAPPLADL